MPSPPPPLLPSLPLSFFRALVGGHADCTGPTRQHELDHTWYRSGNRSALIDLDHEVGIDDLSDVWLVLFVSPRMPLYSININSRINFLCTLFQELPCTFLYNLSVYLLFEAGSGACSRELEGARMDVFFGFCFGFSGGFLPFFSFQFLFQFWPVCYRRVISEAESLAVCAVGRGDQIPSTAGSPF
ncbi:unnamed protein product [Laminaria digitata]